MKLLANENFPLQSVKILKEAGYDTTYIGNEYFGILDNEVMDIAKKLVHLVIFRVI